jgi:hypothetical protein
MGMTVTLAFIVVVLAGTIVLSTNSNLISDWLSVLLFELMPLC